MVQSRAHDTMHVCSFACPAATPEHRHLIRAWHLENNIHYKDLSKKEWLTTYVLLVHIYMCAIGTAAVMCSR